MAVDISVIIPVYNVQDYVAKAIESVLGQKGPEIEVILIDDGSTDNSGKICDEYKRKDGRVSVIHKENEGLGQARNSGLDIATGEYIFFLDSDDWIVDGALSELHAIARENDVDLICFDCFYVPSREAHEFLPLQRNDRIANTEQLLAAYFKGEVSSTSCFKFYRKKLWNNMRFTDVKLHEDAWINHLVLAQCDKAYITNQKYYICYLRPQSLVRSPFTKINLLCIECGRRYVEFAKQKYPSLLNLAYFNLLNRQLYTLDKMHNDGAVSRFRKEYRGIVKDMKQEIPLMRTIDSKDKEVVLQRAFLYVHPLYAICRKTTIRALVCPYHFFKRLVRCR